jgi:hypothetical protein
MLYVALALVVGFVVVSVVFAQTVRRMQRGYDRREAIVISELMDTFTRREDQLVAQIASLAGRSWAPATLYEPQPEEEPEPSPYIANPEILP